MSGMSNDGRFSSAPRAIHSQNLKSRPIPTGMPRSFGSTPAFAYSQSPKFLPINTVFCPASPNELGFSTTFASAAPAAAPMSLPLSCSLPSYSSLNRNGKRLVGREIGKIEKLLESYGFIQCAERDDRLFFHFSQYNGNITELHVNDDVEFEESVDRRTAKPIAVKLIKLVPGTSPVNTQASSFTLAGVQHGSQALLPEPVEAAPTTPEDAQTTPRVWGVVSAHLSSTAKLFPVLYVETLGEEIRINNVRITDQLCFEPPMTTFIEARGQITAEPKKTRPGVVPVSQDQGRVSFEQSGECFFIPFSSSDLVPSLESVAIGDKVFYTIHTDPITGALRAKNVRLDAPDSSASRTQGIISSLKDNFGFIERADKVKEIFFHYSELRCDQRLLKLGIEVDFSIQDRQGKEVASDIYTLPKGTVLFEEIMSGIIEGVIIKPLPRANTRHQSDPLPGVIRYQEGDETREVVFGDRDQHGDFSLFDNDLVTFQSAMDHRDNVKRATNIMVRKETFQKSKEHRETGAVVTLKDGFGFIRCAERAARIFFHFTEVMDPHHNLQLNEEVEFTVMDDPTDESRPIAVRLIVLTKGTVKFEDVLIENVEGLVLKKSHPSSITTEAGDPPKDDLGLVEALIDDKFQEVLFLHKDLTMKEAPKPGDDVEFTLSRCRRSKKLYAKNMRKLNIANNITVKLEPQPAYNLPVVSQPTKLVGFIAGLKDTYGFIESANHDYEYFFHFSELDNQKAVLLGDEYEFTLTKKQGKICAENLCKLPSGTVAPEIVSPEVYEGRVTRPMRSSNPNQSEYNGMIRMIRKEQQDPAAGEGFKIVDQDKLYPFGITSLDDKLEFLQLGDIVNFQIATVISTGEQRATRVVAQRMKHRGRINSIKGDFGFIDFKTDQSDQVFFHISEVQYSGQELRQGDDVEFYLMMNRGKYAACRVKKLCSDRPPDHLRLRTFSLGSSISSSQASRLIVTRAPKGPDGTRGFHRSRAQTVGTMRPLDAVAKMFDQVIVT